MKEIKLTQGKVALVDDEDFEHLNQWRWFADKGGNTYYAVAGVYENGRQVKIKMHRLLLGLKTGDGLVVDHKDHNGLNNQRSNIRICSKAENSRNSQKHKKNTLKYKGVSYRVYKYFSKKKQVFIYRSPVWEAHISLNNKLTHLGSFKTGEEAAIAYNEAAKKYYGEFANLNKLYDHTTHV